MAGIVERIFGTPTVKGEGLRNFDNEAMGGALSGAVDTAGFMGKIVTGANRIFTPGVNVSQVLDEKIDELTRNSKAKLEQTTGAPVTGPGKNGSVPWHFGEGVTTAAGSGVKGMSQLALNGIVNVLAKIPEDKVAQVATQMLGPTLANVALAALKQKIVNPSAYKNIPNSELTKAEVSQDPNLLAQQNFLASNPKTAQKYQQYINEREGRWNAMFKAFKPAPKDDITAGENAVKAFTEKEKSVKAAISADNEKNFSRATSYPKRVIPIDVLKDTIVKGYDDLAAIPVKMRTEEQQDTFKQLSQFRDKYYGKDSQEAMTLAEVKNHLQEWGAMSSKGTPTNRNMFGTLSESLKQRLNDVAGGTGTDAEAAKSLLEAYTKFQANEMTMTKIKNSELGRAIGVDDFGNRFATNPDEIWNKMKSMGPGERKYAMSLLEKEKPELFEDLRKAKFADWIKGAETPGRSANESTFDIGKFVAAVDKNKDDLPFIFPKKEDQAAFMSKVENLRNAVSTSAVAHQPNIAPGVAGSVMGATLNSPGMSMFGSVMAKVATSKLGDPEEIFKLMTDPKMAPKTVVDRMVNQGSVTGQLNKAQGATAAINATSEDRNNPTLSPELDAELTKQYGPEKKQAGELSAPAVSLTPDIDKYLTDLYGPEK